jgi:hypoxanthine-guanine phosphoribosyltransferase
VCTELKEQKAELTMIRQSQAVVLGVLRQLANKIQSQAKRQRIVYVAVLTGAVFF